MRIAPLLAATTTTIAAAAALGAAGTGTAAAATHCTKPNVPKAHVQEMMAFGISCDEAKRLAIRLITTGQHEGYTCEHQSAPQPWQLIGCHAGPQKLNQGGRGFVVGFKRPD
jgi:hypothetical protein